VVIFKLRRGHHSLKPAPPEVKKEKSRSTAGAMLEKAFEHLLREWNTLKQAPILFLLSIVIGAGAGWWFQSKIVEQRITAKDELIRDYLERLHLMPPEGVT